MPLAWAQDGYELDWWTVNGGGGRGGSQSSPYSLDSTVGQADASVWQGDGYVLTGGFGATGVAAEYAIYLPIVMRNN